MTRRAPGRLLLLIVATCMSTACATSTTDLPKPRGESMGDGIYRLVDHAEARQLEPADEPWSPSPFYPAITGSRSPGAHEQDPRVARAMRARGARPLASRSSSAGAAWVFFQFYSNTWSRADGSTCRFAPTCSGFGRQALSTHGLLGVPMTFGRLHRNHSDSSFYDKVGPRLADPLALHDFWFHRPTADERADYRVIDLYLRLKRAWQYTIPEPPVAP